MYVVETKHYMYVSMGEWSWSDLQITIFIQEQNKIFPLNLTLQYVMSSWIRVWSAKPYRSEPHHAEPN